MEVSCHSFHQPLFYQLNSLVPTKWRLGAPQSWSGHWRKKLLPQQGIKSKFLELVAHSTITILTMLLQLIHFSFCNPCISKFKIKIVPFSEMYIFCYIRVQIAPMFN